MTDQTARVDTTRETVEAKLASLPGDGVGWYVEEVRPGHDDEARVYGAGHWGIAKPTPNDPHYRRPIAEWIAESPALVRALLAERAEQDKALAALRQFANAVLPPASLDPGVSVLDEFEIIPAAEAAKLVMCIERDGSMPYYLPTRLLTGETDGSHG